jgi:hypothetical protein
MRKITSLALLALAITAGACTHSPTSASDRGMEPQFDGGVFGGSGNAAGTAALSLPPENTTAAGPEVTAADSTNSRGGVFGGSGN